MRYGDMFKFHHSLHQGSIEGLWRRPATGHPVKNVLIVLVQEFFEPGAITGRELIEMLVHEAADHDVGFLGAAMPGAEAQTAAAGRKIV